MSFDPKKPVRTRDGRKAEIVATGLYDTGMIVAVVTSPLGVREILTCSATGSYTMSQEGHQNDLINLPAKRVFWVNEYVDGFGGYHEDKTTCEKSAESYRAHIGRHRIEVESGRWDE